MALNALNSDIARFVRLRPFSSMSMSNLLEVDENEHGKREEFHSNIVFNLNKLRRFLTIVLDANASGLQHEPQEQPKLHDQPQDESQDEPQYQPPQVKMVCADE